MILIRGTCSHPCTVTSGNKAHITAVACVNADSFTIPPKTIWDRKNLAPRLTVGKFQEQFMDHYRRDGKITNCSTLILIRYATAAWPLLLLDGHSSLLP